MEKTQKFIHRRHPVKKILSFPCPICGRKTEYPLTELKEGAVLTCPFCKLALTLHGHMWEEVKKEIQHLKRKI
jgi:uncharacterized Zn finger protein (UPF0148 family)